MQLAQSILEHFHQPLKEIFSRYIHAQFPAPFSIPRQQQLIYFLSLWICLFWTFHINGIKHYVIFRDWLLSFFIMFSKFIHVVALLHYFFIDKQYSVVWIHHILVTYSSVEFWRNLCFWTLVLEKTLENPLDCKEIKPVYSKMKSTLNIHWKDWCWSSSALATWCEEPDAGKGWR